MQNEKTVYINFFDGIDPIKVNKFIQFTTEVIRQHDPSELYFFISSNGGDVDSGFVLYNFLISLQTKLKVTMHNTGTIDSIANVIFVAGQNRFAAPNASFLFHGVSMNMQGAVSRTTLKESLSRLEGMETWWFERVGWVVTSRRVELRAADTWAGREPTERTC